MLNLQHLTHLLEMTNVSMLSYVFFDWFFSNFLLPKLWKGPYVPYLLTFWNDLKSYKCKPFDALLIRAFAAMMLSTWHCKKYFSHPSVVICFFANPPIKLKLGQRDRWGTTNSKPAGPIIMMGKSEKKPLSSSEIIFITLFSAGATLVNKQPPQTVQLCWAKAIVLSQTGQIFLTFLHPILSAQDHMLSTTGEMLT